MRFVELPSPAGSDCAGWTVGQFPLLHNLPMIRHAVTTRQGPHEGNLHAAGPHSLALRGLLAERLGLKTIAVVRQVHGSRIVEADDALKGDVEADGLMTNREGVGVLGLSADCPIVLAADAGRGAVGMAHASWRGTVGRIAAELIAAMARRYGCRPCEMQAAIGPSAGVCCYEVGEEVVQAAREKLGPSAEGFFEVRAGRTYFDLWRANQQQLTAAGVSEHNVVVAGVCTICEGRGGAARVGRRDGWRFYSYRREGGRAGRFAVVIGRS